MYNPKFRNLTSQQALDCILSHEQNIDQLLAEKKISEWQAWEGYFGLMYEASMWALDQDENEQKFWEIRERMVNKIDTVKFNPFASKNPQVIMIAQHIAALNGIGTRRDN